MVDTRTRLNQCFSAVFAGLDDSRVASATKDTVEGWDSLANFTLLTVIEEEFGVQVDPDDVDRFVSYESILGYLEGRGVGA